MSDLIREYIAVKFLEAAMFIAPKKMGLAIAKGISLTFPVLAENLLKEIKGGSDE